MTKIIKSNSNNYICEGDNLLKIYHHLTVGSKTLLESPMKAGKTYTASELFKLRQNCIKVLLVPKNSLGKDVERRFAKEHKVKMLFEGNNISSEELKDCVIITSPESFLKKVIPHVKELNLDKEMFTIYDEVHLAIDDSSYRKPLYDALNVEKELKGFKTKFTLLGLTATPGILTEFVKFDSFITVNIKNSFKQADTMGLITVNQRIDEIFIASAILGTSQNNPKSKITIRLNDKKKIEKVSKIIEDKTGIKPLIGTSDNSEEVLKIIENKGVIDTPISFFTSYTEVGIEFDNSKEMILLDFEGLNNNPINHNSIIQNMGRYRNGLKACIVYIESDKNSLNPNIKEMIRNNKIIINDTINNSIKLNTPFEGFTKLSDDGMSVEVDCDVDYEVMKRVNNTYNSNLIRNSKDLKRELNKVKTLNVGTITLGKVNYDEMITYLSDYKEKIKADKKLMQEEKKKLKNELNTLIKNMTSEEDFKNFYQHDLIFNNDMKRCIELLEYLEEYEEVKKCYQKLYSLFKNKLTDKQYFELSLKYKSTTRQINAINNACKRDYYKKNNIFPKRDNESREFSIQHHIMNTIEKITGKEKRFRLTKKLMDTILEECTYKEVRGTKKDPYKRLIEVLKTYYNLTPSHNTYVVSSPKDNYNIKYFI